MTAKTCPVCGKPTVKDYRPFCSKRCADLDLGRWLNEDYRVPVAETEDEAWTDITPHTELPEEKD